jgi:hypothetical protein
VTDFEILRSLGQIHPPVTLLVGAPPGVCIRTLATASKPSASRLQHRDLFVDGLRYYLKPTLDGFHMTCDTSVLWGRRRQRARSAALVVGSFSASQDTSPPVTLLRLRARMRPSAALAALLLPAFIGLIVISLAWSPAATIAVVAGLFLSSAISRRFDAAYQANEMVNFVRTVMEDLPAVQQSALPSRGPDVVLNTQERAAVRPWDAVFMDEFDRFYEEQVRATGSPE